MKFLGALLLMFIFAISCANKDKNVAPPVMKNLLTPDEIVSMFNNPNSIQESEEDDEFDQKFIDRVEMAKENGELFKDHENLVRSDFFRTKQLQSENPKPIDLRPYSQKIVNQWDGTCTAHSTVAALEGLYKMKTGNDLKLSERHHWSDYGKYSATASLSSAKKNYIAPDEFWPHEKTKPNVSDISKKGQIKIPHYYYVEDDAQEFYKGFEMGMIG